MKIYTDGSSIQQGKFGGYCAIIVDDTGKEKIISGGVKDTTNNIMELTGIYEALIPLDQPYNITIYSDSQYALNVASGRYEAHKNQELVYKIRRELAKHRHIKYIWVKGHSDHKMNNRCDEIACRESLKIQYKNNPLFMNKFAK